MFAITLTKASTRRNFALANASRLISVLSEITSSALAMNRVDETRVMSRRADIGKRRSIQLTSAAFVEPFSCNAAQAVGEDRLRNPPSLVRRRSRQNALRQLLASGPRRSREWARMTFDAPTDVLRYVVEEGVDHGRRRQPHRRRARRRHRRLRVAVIPHTLAVTTLGILSPAIRSTSRSTSSPNTSNACSPHISARSE